jgi:hypothetical protein
MVSCLEVLKPKIYMNTIPIMRAEYPINLILVAVDLMTAVSGEDCRLRGFSLCILKLHFQRKWWVGFETAVFVSRLYSARW